jgi:hypothetical protein
MDVKSDIYFQYPFPIAVTFHNADNTREPVEAHDRILKLFEVTLKYLASIMICEYLEDGPDDPQVNRALGGLARPSLGQWNGFLREILNYYNRTGKTSKLLIPRLYELYNDKAKDRPAMCAAFTMMRNYLEDRHDPVINAITVRDFFDKMIQYRNKTAGHGALTNEHCQNFNDPLLAALQEMLGVYGVLKEHRLMYVEEVKLVRGKYTHELATYMGPMRSRLKNAYVASDQSKYRIEDRLYLCPPNDDTPTLCLHPLMIAMNGDVLFLNESARDKEIEYLSYQTGQIKRPDRLMEDFKEILGAVMAPGEGQAAAAAAPLSAFDEGRRAFDAGQWAAAVAAFAKVEEGDARAAEAGRMSATADRREHVTQHIEQIRALAKMHRWDEALAVGESLLSDLADDPDDNSAIQAEVARLRTAEEFYRQALTAYQAHRWERATDLVRQVRAVEPDYRDSAQMAARMERWTDLYERGLAALSRREWVDALTLLRQLEAQQKDYKDIQALLKRAQKGLDDETDLIERYDQARTQMAVESWQEAYDLLKNIEEQRPNYREVRAMLATVGDKLVIKCWSCGAAIPLGRRFCGACGQPREKPVVKQPDSHPVVAAATPSSGYVCWNCGATNATSRKFCGTCGSPREKPSSQPLVTAAVVAPVAPVSQPVAAPPVSSQSAAVGAPPAASQPAAPADLSAQSAAVGAPPAAAAPGSTYVCWNCGTTNAATRKFCGSCGSPRERPASQPVAGPAQPASQPVQGPPASQPPASQPPGAATVRCPYCGYENAATRKFCGSCGQSLRAMA